MPRSNEGASRVSPSITRSAAVAPVPLCFQMVALSEVFSARISLLSSVPMKMRSSFVAGAPQTRPTVGREALIAVPLAAFST